MNLFDYKMMRVASASINTNIGNCEDNANTIIKSVQLAIQKKVKLVIFPELSITGYSCGDLFLQNWLQESALKALQKIKIYTSEQDHSPIIIVGLPMIINTKLYDVAAIVFRGETLAIIPKTNLINSGEYYEKRWFSNDVNSLPEYVVNEDLSSKLIPIGVGIQLIDKNFPEFCLSVEICEDIWVPNSPSNDLASSGSTVIANLSASTAVVGKKYNRRKILEVQSKKTHTVYIYSNSHISESTTDVVYGGDCFIIEDGEVLSSNVPYTKNDTLLISDIDLEIIQNSRLKHPFPPTLFTPRRVYFDLYKHSSKTDYIYRFLSVQPYIPNSAMFNFNDFLDEIIDIQTLGLYRRLVNVSPPMITLGLSGGLDSTLSFLTLIYVCRFYDIKKQFTYNIYNLPGFGQDEKSKVVDELVKEMGCVCSSIDIRNLTLQTLKDMKYNPFGLNIEECDTVEQLEEKINNLQADGIALQDTVFENIQARIRTNILMNSGFLIGTSDLSEIALGYSTYGGDHISMYNPNVNIFKSLIPHILHRYSERIFSGIQSIIKNIIDSPISPGLIPGQKTEDIIGEYKFHDFILYYFLKYGFSSEKIIFLAKHTVFKQEIKKFEETCAIFFNRFFTNQYKRSCIPDGPKIFDFSLSPRSDWRMPSDIKNPLKIQ